MKAWHFVNKDRRLRDGNTVAPGDCIMKQPELPIDPPSEDDFDAEEEAREAEGERQYEAWKNEV